MYPSYIDLYQTGKLNAIKEQLTEILRSCILCPRECRIDRIAGETGFCHTAHDAKISSAYLHFGEEPELVAAGGSGTLFFSYCNLGCVYCQNYRLSHAGEGEAVSPSRLAQMMIDLQHQGAQNINFVSPTHVIAQIIQALPQAIEAGLRIPLVYNCGGYESIATLKTIAGVFDLYMPDIKYFDDQAGFEYSGVSDYWEKAACAVKEMYAQVEDLVIEDGRARRGLLIRHLVLPGYVEDSYKILDFIKDEISQDTYVNIMDQYYPCYLAGQYPRLSRRITHQEYRRVIIRAQKIGLHRGFNV
ncbi:MAG: radical SAM protein [Candidatus Omnitrophica bacterium]|nr:radical SAM protein [Candidatus Omnitrophota bacterium]